jgi:DNA-binding XRE family transcriptional regulator
MEKNLADKIVDFRGKYNLTQVDFAKMCKVSHTTIIHIENSKIKPTRLTKAKIENVINREVFK